MAKEKATDKDLQEMGIDLSEPEGAVQKLRSLRASGGANEVRIADTAGRIAIPAAAALLAEMESTASGVLRREVRRALFKLRQHGIAPPPAVREPVPTVAAPAQAANAIISPVDHEGARLVWLYKTRVQGGLSRLQGLTSDSDGLVGANLTHISRRELREERQEIERSSRIKLVDADYRLGDFILCEAYRRTPEARLGHVGNFLALRAEILAAPPPTDYQHPIYEEFAATLSQEPSPELLKEPELAGWVIAEADLKPYVDEIGEIRQSPLVLNQYQQEERVNAVVARAVDHFFGGEAGAMMRRRLEDTAYYLARVGHDNPARWAASAAAAIRDGQPLGRLAFFVEYVKGSLGVVLSEQQAQAEQQPRLIMTPAEMMRAQAAARARRSRS
jgi:hypothetical protein